MVVGRAAAPKTHQALNRISVPSTCLRNPDAIATATPLTNSGQLQELASLIVPSRVVPDWGSDWVAEGRHQAHRRSGQQSFLVGT